jgi:hypothetical protein
VADGKEGADQVDPQDLAPELDRLLEQRHQAAADTGIGEDHVDPAQLFHRLLDEALHVGLGAGIGGHRDRPPARRLDLGRGLLDRRGRLVDHHHRRPFGGKELGAGAADAAARPGHDRTLALKAAHAALPIPVTSRPTILRSRDPECNRFG